MLCFPWAEKEGWAVQVKVKTGSASIHSISFFHICYVSRLRLWNQVIWNTTLLFSYLAKGKVRFQMASCHTKCHILGNLVAWTMCVFYIMQYYIPLKFMSEENIVWYAMWILILKNIYAIKTQINISTNSPWLSLGEIMHSFNFYF